jgi:hypothetical protein
MSRLLSGALLVAALGSGVCAHAYGREILRAPDARAAAPFAAPFALFAVSCGAALALSLVSLSDRES